MPAAWVGTTDSEGVLREVIMVVVAWIIAVWLLSLAAFVALRAHSASKHHRPQPGRHRRSAGMSLPAQREASDPSNQATPQG
jgi:hypothetical protein